MPDVFNEIAKAPPFALALGALIAFAVVVWVVRVVGQVLYVLLTGHVPERRRAHGTGTTVDVEAGPTSGFARWLFGEGGSDGRGGDGGGGGGNGD